jgi:hypothetical protein
VEGAFKGTIGMVYPGTLFHRRQRGIPMKIGVKSEHCPPAAPQPWIGCMGGVGVVKTCWQLSRILPAPHIYHQHPATPLAHPVAGAGAHPARYGGPIRAHGTRHTALRLSCGRVGEGKGRHGTLVPAAGAAFPTRDLPGIPLLSIRYESAAKRCKRWVPQWAAGCRVPRSG